MDGVYKNITLPSGLTLVVHVYLTNGRREYVVTKAHVASAVHFLTEVLRDMNEDEAEPAEPCSCGEINRREGRNAAGCSRCIGQNRQPAHDAGRGEDDNRHEDRP